MRKAVLLSSFVLFMCIAQAQRGSGGGYGYKNALGVKVWDGVGVSFKHFFNKNAGEFIGHFGRNYFRLTGLYEIHGPVSGAPGLKWYAGPGVHIGFYNDDYYYRGRYYGRGRGRGHVGIDGVVGLDYKFKGAPINVSFDFQPAFEFDDGVYYSGHWGGLGIRFTF
ncbi:MAG TPA: hypothetical protein VHK69_02185 [Chitinophagaceae bacterium]|jgi:hypothetical protein|nr:hypothetical protein [Chitinophagaceae bacterium]